ncbi:MAG: manganese-dependent inorganic pyrophosphatase [Gammaproteobacteria bacterium]|nr:manganese-dependent inorganic pyrophosphatase [Gammaproteobacteria bacterium]
MAAPEPGPVYVVGHKRPDTDSICSAIGYASLRQALGDGHVLPARAGALNPESRWVLERFGLTEPELLARATGLRLILVDHNEVAQALDDIEHAEILEVWEHHRIGDLHTARPILFHCEPVGATATLIAEQYLLHEIPIPASIAGGLLSAILSDTLLLASPTTCDKDRRMATRLAALAGVGIDELGAGLMAARGCVASLPTAELFESDCKHFDFAGKQVGIAQVEVPDAIALLERREALVAELEAQCQAAGLDLMVLMVTDIGRRGSHFWAAGPVREQLARVLGNAVDPVQGLWAEGWMSRKKQLVPALEAAISGDG